jgi:hypothetical protein
MIGEANKVFRRINVIPDWINGHFIQWEIDPFFKGSRPYNFSLEISEAINFSEIAASKPNLGEVFFAVDDFNIRQSWSPYYAYRIILETSDNKRYCSLPRLFSATQQDHRKYAMAAEIIRKEIMLCRYAGEEAWLLKRKIYGSKAKTIANKNVDPVSGAPIADVVNEDYGVGLDDGFYPPVPCVYYIESSQQDKQLDPQGIGVKETFSTIMRLPGYPIIEVRDVLCVAKDGTRFSVQSKGSKQFPGTNIVLTQKASMNLIPSTDTVYSIAIPLSL